MSGDGKNGSIYDLLSKIDEENNLIERLRFSLQEKPKADKIATIIGVPMSGHKSPMDFPAELARDTINEFCPLNGSVLDPCHGWGGRLIGFHLSKAANYVGIDCSEMTNKGVVELNKDISKYTSKNAILICSQFEKYETDERFDFALTSPPYFDREQYEGSDQSFRVHDSYEDWKNGFYQTLIKKVYNLLKNDCYFCLQVGSQFYPLEKDAISLANKIGFKYIETRSTSMTSVKDHGIAKEDGEVLIVLMK